MKLNNKGEAYIYVILGISILAFVMIFGFNFKKFIPKTSSDTTYKDLRDSVVSAGKNYIVANDYLRLEDYEETTFSKKEANGLDKNLNCQNDDITCKKIAIDELIASGYLSKLIDKNKEECNTKNAYLIVARVISNNAQKNYNYYYKIDNLMCGNKKLVNTSDNEYYIIED